MAVVLWAFIIVLFVMWAMGFALHIAGSLIHLLLVVIAILVIINLITGRSAKA